MAQNNSRSSCKQFVTSFSGDLSDREGHFSLASRRGFGLGDVITLVSHPADTQ
jgi:hypothetical protein